MKRLIIMQGHSGSGKSTFIKEIARLGIHEGIAISTDKYFYDDEGNYNFDENKLDEYHMKTFTECINIMQNATRKNIEYLTIWLDNTNWKTDNVKPYLRHAKNNNFQVVYIRMNGEFKSKAPVEVVEQQKKDLRGFKYE